jgi:diacylglycerol kinase family enzyme
MGGNVRTLIVHNLKSGFGSNAVFEFERALLRDGDEVTLRALPEEGGAREAVRDAEDFDLVVVSGGDGTVTNLLFELRDRNVLTCIFPSGTANLLFANLGSAPEPSAIAHACRLGRSVHTDLGVMRWTDEDGAPREHGFGIMAGTGFDAQLMRAAVPNKKSMGEAAYFAAALSNIHPDIIHFDITVDGRHCERDGIACIVANNAMIQGEIEVVPNSTMTDGKLDVILLETSDAVQLLRPIFAGMVDKSGNSVGRPYLEHFTGETIEVKSSKPIPMQADGEVIPGLVSSYVAQVIPAANRLVVDSLSRYEPDDDGTSGFGGTDTVAFPKI